MTDIETTLAERGERYGVFAQHALTWSAVWKDDSQVRELHAVMLGPVRGGRCEVEIQTL